MDLLPGATHTRYAILVHLPRQAGYGQIRPTKNGPALAGYGALTMKDALAKSITHLPEQLRRSLTWDRGKELSAHALLTKETGLPVYFADAKSPWQRGSNEHLMVCFGNTSRKALTSPGGTPPKSQLSPPP
ncbi:IS30 family transposase [Nesterenkonia lacusekhoensis]|uniref:IS30 family transposase n=1 Tax=Nesterenkonia lacusekhoensis TaxID=150832 RepID=A0ABS4T0Y9_9MICC|nr:IS30 family transposase [Nesterenkonia lacusekhoensis]